MQDKIPSARELMETASAAADKVLAEAGELHPMYHAVSSSGQHHLMPMPVADKSMAIALVRAVFKDRNIVCYCFMDEAWLVEHDSVLKATKNQPPPAMHPDRREVVVFTAEDDNGMLAGTRTIDRAQVKPVLGPLTIDHSMTLAGRLVGLLPQKGTTQ